MVGWWWVYNTNWPSHYFLSYRHRKKPKLGTYWRTMTAKSNLMVDGFPGANRLMKNDDRKMQLTCCIPMHRTMTLVDVLLPWFGHHPRVVAMVRIFEVARCHGSVSHQTYDTSRLVILPGCVPCAQVSPIDLWRCRKTPISSRHVPSTITSQH